MISISELGRKLVPMINVSLTILNKENQLTPMQHVIHNLQMGIYWFKSAHDDLEALTQELVSEEKKEYTENTLIVPTLFSTEDHLNFLKSSLTDLVKELEHLTDSMTSVPTIQYKVQRGSDRIYECIFNNELAINYYKQLTDGRAGK